jgi:hypothetical protein
VQEVVIVRSGELRRIRLARGIEFLSINDTLLFVLLSQVLLSTVDRSDISWSY